ncbi:fanconi-associated nuclease 1 [Plectropomus leopardus]|uniref:fanconi-associated nuclease 1 n=1 Tax=Plectropomus leopardus TaxID=160734 RepID=UPI001C4C9395|nr:fanconi-associated nuclease 1 [Plectropomus leopardus]XP_042352111.1 fanconi-associated nuclease 1 [Plectropomus leopardus]
MMTERASKDKPRRSLSLSKSKKKGNVNAGITASAATTTPITSFFSSQPPPKLACPLCGQLVPRFKINEHIDFQCQNFERGDCSAASASNSVVQSIQLSPRRSPPKSPELDAKREEEVKDTETSPYFKKNNSQQAPREIKSKSVVRRIDLGSLSSKLSRKCHKVPERTQTVDAAMCPENETLNSSQKENLLIQSLEDKKDSVAVTDFTETCDNTTTDLSDKRSNLEQKASKSETFQKVLTPKVRSSPSKLSKRKKGTSSSSRVSVFRKKAKYEGNSREGTSRESVAETTNRDQLETKVPSSTTWDPPPSSEETSKKSGAAINSDSLAESGAENIASDQAVESSHPPRLPYYLRNFRTVLQAVLENKDDGSLFNQDDMSLVHAFENLSVMGQKLYVRLFQRKLRWLQVNKLDYEEICSDLGPVAQELVQSGFLQSESDLQDLGEALDLLPAPELKALAKTFHLGNSGIQKQQLVDGLLRLSRQKSLFSQTPAQNNIGTVILKRAKQLASSCVRLCRGPRAVFSRILLLFSLTDTMDEEEIAAGGQSQLFTILLVNSGRLAFPDYTVQRKAKVFQDREDLIRYEASMRALLEIVTAMQGGQWEEAMELYTAAKSAWQELRKNHDLSHQQQLPVFLRSFTVGWAYTRILSRGVEILQRLRRYEEAVEELRSLLEQFVYCPDSRGRWWDRLALNLHQHLKKPEQAICAIRDGLSDPLVRTGHKLSLHQRAVRMKESASLKKYRLQLKDLPTIHVQDVTHVTIRGQLFPHEGGMGKSRFLITVNGEGEESADATVICSVEELSLAHYRQQGFDQGIHGEGSTFSTLFALLLWDIIFMDGIPDVFRNPYQTCPLDLYTDCFYENRKEAIDSRVQLLSESSVETLHDMLEDVWTSQESKVCSLVNWERFSSLQQAQSLVSCLGGVFLGGVIARMSKDYRHCRGGLPDLVVWNTSNNTYKLVEVKGPNDRLSQKQQIWLDELQKLGAGVEVCHVTATGARGARLE